MNVCSNIVTFISNSKCIFSNVLIYLQRKLKMINNYYTLLKIEKELKSQIGSTLQTIYKQDKHSIIFEFDSGTEIHNWVFFERVNLAAFFNSSKLIKSKKAQTLFEEYSADILQDVELFDYDRILKLTFINHNIYLSLIGYRKSNIYFTDKNSIIENSLKLKNEFIGNNINEVIKRKLISDDFKSIDESLQKKYLLSTEYINDFKSKRFTLIDIYRYKEFLINSTGKVYKSDNTIEFSLVDLNKEKIYESENISDAIEFYQSRISFKLDFEDKKNNLLKKLNKQVAYLSNSKRKIEEILIESNRIEEYRNYGNLLLSNANLKEKGLSSVLVNDWSGNQVNIKLQEKLSIRENADKYFEKARNAETQDKINLERLPEIENKLHNLTNIVNDITNSSNNKELKQVIEKYPILQSETKAKSDKNEIEKFRVFELSLGFKLLVGKNAANNDELTLKYASPHDLWLHARGVGGSHCIIKRNKNQQIPPEVLEEAAEIAAYYSQMRKGQYVPVVYTEKKYVRKPKGFNIGQVSLSKEEVIMVTPKLPN